MLLAIVHWTISFGIPIALTLLALIASGYGISLLWKPFCNRRIFMRGHKSITDQFLVKPGTKVEITAPEPPCTWSPYKQVLFRNGQLEALRLLEDHNLRVAADLKRSFKRASGPKRRK